MTKVSFPEITWVNKGERDGDDRRWKGEAEGYEFDVRYHWGGNMKGLWTAIVNHGAIQTGGGPHGYTFPDAETAKRAAEQEMKDRITAKVEAALATLGKYTNLFVS